MTGEVAPIDTLLIKEFRTGFEIGELPGARTPYDQDGINFNVVSSYFADAKPTAPYDWSLDDEPIDTRSLDEVLADHAVLRPKIDGNSEYQDESASLAHKFGEVLERHRENSSNLSARIEGGIALIKAQSKELPDIDPEDYCGIARLTIGASVASIALGLKSSFSCAVEIARDELEEQRMTARTMRILSAGRNHPAVNFALTQV